MWSLIGVLLQLIAEQDTFELFAIYLDCTVDKGFTYQVSDGVLPNLALPPFTLFFKARVSYLALSRAF